MKKIERIAGLIGLLLLLAFFAPYLYKLSQIDITIILMGGCVMATYDFITGHQ
jgi:hypothetical protein